MKTILVPTENSDAMRSALETALLLAQRCDSYMEGFALRWGIGEFIAAGALDAIPLDRYREDIEEEAKQARQNFESFMQEHHVQRSTGTAVSLSFGWLDDAARG